MKWMAYLLVLLLAVSAASAQSTIQNPFEPTDTTLYFHLDAFQDFPINTQLPSDDFAKGSTRGVIASTSSCTPEALPGQFHQDHHTVYGFSTPGYVEYGFTEDGGPRIHPERGLAYDVELDRDAGMTGYWYLKTTVDSAQAPSQVNQLPLLVPQVVVEFTMRTGDEVGFGAEAYNSGQLIANGKSEPMQLIADATVTPGYTAQPDGSHVYEIQVPMTVDKDKIPSDEKTGGYNIRVDVSMSVPGCDSDRDASFMPGSVELFTAPDYRPRLDLTVLNPVKIEYIHPQFVGNDMLIHTSLNSPWGNYDVDESDGGIELIITGPTAAKAINRVAFEQKHHEHGFHFEPVDVTYQWDYLLDQADDQVYEMTVKVWNDQRTAFATGSASIDVGDQSATDDSGNLVTKQELDDVDTPGFGIAGLLAAIGLAAVVRRRI